MRNPYQCLATFNHTVHNFPCTPVVQRPVCGVPPRAMPGSNPFCNIPYAGIVIYQLSEVRNDERKPLCGKFQCEDCTDPDVEVQYGSSETLYTKPGNELACFTSTHIFDKVGSSSCVTTLVTTE